MRGQRPESVDQPTMVLRLGEESQRLKKLPQNHRLKKGPSECHQSVLVCCVGRHLCALRHLPDTQHADKDKPWWAAIVTMCCPSARR